MEKTLQVSKDEDLEYSVLKYHISVAAKIAAGSCGQKRRQKSCYFFIPDLTLNKSMINIPPPPMDVFGEAVCRITDRAKIQTTWIETNVKSNLQLLRTFLIQPIFIKIAVGSVDLSFSKDRMRIFLFCEQGDPEQRAMLLQILPGLENSREFGVGTREFREFFSFGSDTRTGK